MAKSRAGIFSKSDRKAAGENFFRNPESYARMLGDSDHDIWNTMKSSGLSSEADYYYRKIRSCGESGVLEFAFYLNPELPYPVPVDDNGRTVNVNDIDEYYSAMNSGEMMYFGFQADDAFIGWLNARWPRLGFEARQIAGGSGSREERAERIHFAITADYGFDGLRKGESALYDLEDYANQLVANYEEFARLERHPDRSVDSLEMTDDSQLLAYFKARKADPGKIEWIQWCQKQVRANREKFGPYSTRIANLKAAAGILGEVPGITVHGKTFRTPDDIRAAADKISWWPRSQVDFIADWATLFYQESPFIEQTPSYGKTLEYCNLLEQSLPGCWYMQRRESLRDAYADARKENGDAWAKTLDLRRKALTYGVLPMAVVLLGVALCLLVMGATAPGVYISWALMALGFGALVFAWIKVRGVRRLEAKDRYTARVPEDSLRRHEIGTAFDSLAVVLPWNAPKNYPVCVYTFNTGLARGAARTIISTTALADIIAFVAAIAALII